MKRSLLFASIFTIFVTTNVIAGEEKREEDQSPPNNVLVKHFVNEDYFGQDGRIKRVDSSKDKLSHTINELQAECKQFTDMGFNPKTTINVDSATPEQIKQLEEELKAFKEGIFLRYKGIYDVIIDYGFDPSSGDAKDVKGAFSQFFCKYVIKYADSKVSKLKEAHDKEINELKQEIEKLKTDANNNIIKCKPILSTLFPDKKYTSFENISSDDLAKSKEQYETFKNVANTIKLLSINNIDLMNTKPDQADKQMRIFFDGLVESYYKSSKQYKILEEVAGVFKAMDRSIDIMTIEPGKDNVREIIKKLVNDYAELLAEERNDKLQATAILSKLFPDKKYTSFEEVTEEDTKEVNDKIKKLKIADKVFKDMTDGQVGLMDEKGNFTVEPEDVGAVMAKVIEVCAEKIKQINKNSG